MNLFVRAEATQKTIDQFYDQPFEWGVADCAILACRHLDNLGIANPLDKVIGYTDEKGARKALVKLGVKGMEELADKQGFERIAPAAAILGDLVAIPGGEEGNEWLGLGVALANGRILAFANDKAMIGPVEVATIAWRVSNAVPTAEQEG